VGAGEPALHAQLVAQQCTIARLEKTAQLHNALYAIADLASSNLDMDEMLRAIHAIVERLMYAKNMYIALHNRQRDTRRYMYYADENPYPLIDTKEEVPVSELRNSLTMAVIQHGRAAMGPSADLLKAFGLSEDHALGPQSLDWLGVPMIADGVVHGAVIVQSYDQPNRYTEEDRSLLAFVAQHILTAMQRKQARVELELRVDERTHELADTVQQLREQINERQRAEQQLAYSSLHDALTGLPNRAYFYEAMSRARDRYQRNFQQGYAVLYLDLDRFKVVNDSIGHHVGDAMLQEVAHRLEVCVRPPDLVARLGGDEFAILLETTASQESVCHVAQRVIDALSVPMLIAGSELFTSASVGIVIGHMNYQGAEDILRDADVAMYRAKAHGRHRFEMFDERLHQQALLVMTLESDLRRAIQREEFEPYFQPIVRLRDGHVMGYEALLRWQHPERGVLAPDAFLAVAEDNGSIDQIDWLMYEATCGVIARFPDANTYVTINVSPRHFRAADLADRLLQLLVRHALPARRLRIELTEGALLENPEQVLCTLTRLRKAGVAAVLDDFGTGYSSLSYLHRFPLQTLKIDRSFVSALQRGHQGGSTAVVRAVLALANTLGMDVVAEGIETREQCEYLQEMACAFGQGFLFSPARPIGTFAAQA